MNNCNFAPENPCACCRWLNVRRFSVLLVWVLGATAGHAQSVDQLAAFMNEPIKSENIHIIITNYAPTYAFKDMAAYKEAKRSLPDRLTAAVVSTAVISVDSLIPGYVYREARDDSSSSGNKSFHSRALRGQFKDVWWDTTPRNFNVLTNSLDGSFVENGKTNRAFRFLKLDALSYFSLGIPGFIRGSFTFRRAGDNDDIEWKAQTEQGDAIGTMKTTGNLLELSAVISGTTRKYDARVIWEATSSRPKAVELLDAASNRILISYTEMQDGPRAWMDYPAAYSYLYHTNGQEVVVFIGSDGSRTFQGVQNQVVGTWDGFPTRRMVLLIPVLSLFGGLLIWRLLRRRQQ